VAELFDGPSWIEFINEWQRELSDLVRLIPDWSIDPEDVARRFGEPMKLQPASAEMVSQIVTSGVFSKHPDYVSLLAVSNGLRVFGFDAQDIRVAGVEQVSDPFELASDERQDLLETLDYAYTDSSWANKPAVLEGLKFISFGCTDGRYLLDTRPDSNVSAIELRNHFGVTLYPSFTAMMRAERSRTLKGLRSLLS